MTKKNLVAMVMCFVIALIIGAGFGGLIAEKLEDKYVDYVCAVYVDDCEEGRVFVDSFGEEWMAFYEGELSEGCEVVLKIDNNGTTTYADDEIIDIIR